MNNYSLFTFLKLKFYVSWLLSKKFYKIF